MAAVTLSPDLRTVEVQLEALPFAPKFWRSAILGFLGSNLGSIQPTELKSHVARLNLLCELASKVTDSRFLVLCNDLHSETQQGKFLKAAGLPRGAAKQADPIAQFTLFSNQLEHSDPGASLYCALNGAILPPFTPPTYFHANLSTSCIANALCELGKPKLACDILENSLEFPANSITVPSIRSWLHTWTSLLREMTPTPGVVVVPIITSLMRAFRECGRLRHALDLFQTWLFPASIDLSEGFAPEVEQLHQQITQLLEGCSAFTVGKLLIENVLLGNAIGNPQSIVSSKVISDNLQSWMQNTCGASPQFGPHLAVRVCTALALLDRRLGDLAEQSEDASFLWLQSLHILHQVLCLDVSRIEPFKRAKVRAQSIRKLIDNAGRDFGIHVACELAKSLSAVGHDPCRGLIPEYAAPTPLAQERDSCAMEFLRALLHELAPKQSHHFAPSGADLVRPIVSGARTSMRLEFLSTLVKFMPGTKFRMSGVALEKWMNIDWDSCRVLSELANDLSWLSERPEDIPLTVIAEFAELWVDKVAGGEQPVPSELLDRVVSWCCKAPLDDKVTGDDRVLAAEQLRRVRSRIMDVAFRKWSSMYSRRTPIEDVRDAMRWSAELRQRVVLEAVAAGAASQYKTNSPVAAGSEWPFAEAAELGSNDATSNLGTPSSEHLVAIDDDCGEASEGTALPNDALDWATKHSAVCTGLRNERTEVSSLSKLLGNDAVIFECVFGARGEAQWIAYRPPTGAGQNDDDFVGGSSEHGADYRIGLEVAKHEMAVQLLHLSDERAHAWRKKIDGLQHLLPQISDSLKRSNEFGQEIERLAMDAERTFVAVLDRVAKEFRFVGALLRPLTRRSIHRKRNSLVTLHDRDFQPMLCCIAEFLLSTPKFCGPHDSLTKRSLLNRQTEYLLKAVSAELKLDRMSKLLGNECRTNLVSVTSDVWNSIPIALLPVDGHPLFTHVRSMRSSHSLLLDELARRIEQDALNTSGTGGDLFCASWFDGLARQGEPFGDWARYLHGLHRNIANSSRVPRRYFAVAETPKACVGTLATSLPMRPHVIATVMGHGGQDGVRLAKDPDLGISHWNGEGVDLSKVELLNLVSCSIGRIEQTGQLDADGFCTRLAQYGGRASIACRWKVLVDEAVRFSDHVVRTYVGLRDDPSNDIRCHNLRALALNKARHDFWNKGAWNKGVGINVAAAFELYGLG